MRAALNQRNATTLPAPTSGRQTYFDAKLPGFGLRVSSNGHRSWVACYRSQGRKRRFTLGTVAKMDAEAARTAALDVFARVRHGEDPAGEKQGARRAETFGGLAELYLAKHAAAKKDGGKRDRAILERELLPKWRSLRLEAIRRRDVRALLEGMVERDAPVAANRALALIRKMFNFAIGRELVTVNPCAGLERPAKEAARDRVLSADELRRLWTALEGEPLTVAGFFRLALLTAQRPGEVKGMRWDELELGATMWTIPAERSKNGKAHRVPLSAPAVAILRELETQANGSPFVLPSSESKSGHLSTLQKPTRRVCKAADISNMHPHDLRRAAASAMAEAGVDRLTIKHILNHSQAGDVTAVYERYGRDPEKRKALEAWARRLHQIVTGEAAAKVVPLRSA